MASMPATLENTRVYYVRVPVGEPEASTFEVRKETIDTAAALPEGHILVENLYLSVDPYMVRLDRAKRDWWRKKG